MRGILIGQLQGKEMREHEVPLHALFENPAILLLKQKCVPLCTTLYLLRQHHGNQLSRASAGSSVGCCIQKKQAAHSWSVSKTFWRASSCNYDDTHLTFLVSIHYTDPQCTVSIAHAEARRGHIYDHNHRRRCMSDFREKHYFSWHNIVCDTTLQCEREYKRRFERKHLINTFDVQVWAGIF